MINKTTLKNLPLLTILAAGLVLSPTITMAGYGDRNHVKEKYSHDDRQSHSKGHKRSNKHSNKHYYKSHGKSHKGKHGYSSKHRYNKGYGHHNEHTYYKRDHHNRRHDRHRVHNHASYIVNDHHYSDSFYALDPLRFMIGLHTDNFDITFRD